MKGNERKAASIPHAEYEILRVLKSEVDLSELKERMTKIQVKNERDKKRQVTLNRRFDKAAENLWVVFNNMMEIRRKKLPESHPRYEASE
tara:strand:- start:235 stop:504 length:270 start_codon:yes stop_codon:yes gene_type:complete